MRVKYLFWTTLMGYSAVINAPLTTAFVGSVAISTRCTGTIIQQPSCLGFAAARDSSEGLTNSTNHHQPVDDDDVSQHDFMATPKRRVSRESVSLKSNEAKNSTRKAYRRAEEWHEEYIAKNPEGAQVLAHLKQEKAQWSKTFGSFGEGI